jgi:hypothetical protein
MRLGVMAATAAATLLGACVVATGAAAAPPRLPVGADAYRQWELLPMLRLGQRTYLTSTYDRGGGNRSADASNFLRLHESGAIVTEAAGPGVVHFVRFNHWHGSPWRFVTDRTVRVVRETNTADPTRPRAPARFLPAALYPEPMAVTWPTSKGADLLWVPWGFRRFFQLAYGRTHYGTGYQILSRYPEGATNLSRAPTRLSRGDRRAIARLLARAGRDLAPASLPRRRGRLDVRGGTRRVIALRGRNRVVRALQVSAPEGQALSLGRLRLRITWDGRRAPSVDAPLDLLSGAASLYNREGREHLVRSLFASVRFRDGRVWLSLYFPMPFRRSADVMLSGAPVTDVRWSVAVGRNPLPAAWTGYFHATYQDHGEPPPGRDLVFLDTGRAGEPSPGSAWCGSFVGTSFSFSDRARLGTLEGDPHFYFDDARTPQGIGTGTEEWAGGGDYWSGMTATLPLAGHPVGAPSPEAMRSPEDGVQGAYRWLLADAMPFGLNARIRFQHGGLNESEEHYRSVAYWYGKPGRCLHRTDRFDPGDRAEARRHSYRVRGPSRRQRLRSALDTGDVVAPTWEATGRVNRGASQFTLRSLPRNRGLLLRRTLDQGYPDQDARVLIRHCAGDRCSWRRVGRWFTPGSSRVVFSFPPGELDPAQPEVRDDGRRFKDSELLISPRYTRGRSRLTFRIVPRLRPRPLLPGESPFPSAWTEYRYTLYAYRLPAG